MNSKKFQDAIWVFSHPVPTKIASYIVGGIMPADILGIRKIIFLENHDEKKTIEKFSPKLIIVSKVFHSKVINLLEYAKEKSDNENSQKTFIEKTWKSIILSEGSVQHFEWMSDWHKEVFKTAFELDQRWVVDHAGDRQKYICQGQSLNLFFPAGTEKSVVNHVHVRAWKKKLKGLYYLRTNSGASAEKVSQQVKQNKLQDYQDDDCLSCQG